MLLAATCEHRPLKTKQQVVPKQSKGPASVSFSPHAQHTSPMNTLSSKHVPWAAHLDVLLGFVPGARRCWK